jgi:hypothetical protein
MEAVPGRAVNRKEDQLLPSDVKCLIFPFPSFVMMSQASLEHGVQTNNTTFKDPNFLKHGLFFAAPSANNSPTTRQNSFEITAYIMQLSRLPHSLSRLH